MCFTWYNLFDHFKKHDGWFAQVLSKIGTFLALAKILLTQRGFILWGGGNYFSFNFIPLCLENSFISIGNSFLLIFIFCYAYISFGNYFAY